MAWSYRKRIKIIPGVHMNLSKNGISTSIGVRGVNMTFGGSGTYLNTGIPGTGISQRQKLAGSGKKYSPPLPSPTVETAPAQPIFSADVHEITSQDMQGVKEAISLAIRQKQDLINDLKKVNSSLKKSKLKKNLSYAFLVGLVKKDIPAKLSENIKLQKEASTQIKEQIQNSCVDLTIDFDEEVKEKFEKVYTSFQKLITCHKIWDVTSAQYQDRIKTRSSAGILVNKREVRFSLRSLPFIKSQYQALYFKNANGADLYFYPSFVVMYVNAMRFAVIGIEELRLHYRAVRFTETGIIPKDSRIIDRTWAKVNKNGTPDKRFKGNYQIPVVRYGEISLSTPSGLNEEYEFSNYEFTEEFGNAFSIYQDFLIN